MLQLNIEKAGLPLLCYSLVTTTKTKHKGVPCYDYYNTRYEVSSIPDQLCDEVNELSVEMKKIVPEEK